MVRILSMKEASYRALYSEKHIRRLSKAGLFPPILRLGPKRVGILESALNEWIENRIPAAATTTSGELKCQTIKSGLTEPLT